MKQMLKIILVLGLFLSLSGCTGSSGGTTVDPTPNPPTPTPPTGPTIGTFNKFQSTFQVLNSSNAETSVSGVNETVKLKLVAKDQFGNLLTGLNIKFARINSALPDLSPTETSSGTYEFSYNYGDQINEEFAVLNNNVSVNMNKTLFISFCNGSPNISAAPFHNSVVKNLNTYYIICTGSQLAQAANFETRNYILGTNIDLSSFYIDADVNLIPDNQFRIGSDISGYSGIFLGYNLTISNFEYYDESATNVGLFGKLISGAKIQDLSISSLKVKGLNKVGSLAGSMEITSTNNIEISGVSVLSGEIKSTVGNQQGGFAGLIDGTGSTGNISITNATALTVLSLNNSVGTRSELGGFAGLVKRATINQTYVNSSVSYTDKSGTISDLGGAFGKLELSSTIITNFSLNSTLTVNKGTNVGGYAGSLSSVTLADQTNTSINFNQNGSLSGDLNYSGGLFGRVQNSSLTNFSAYTLASNVRNPYGGFVNSLENSSSTKVVLGGTISFNSDFVGGLYSSIDNSSLNKNLSYIGLSSSNSNVVIGGITALSKNASSINQSSYEGSINAPNASYMAGIVASTQDNLQISNVSSKGNITGSLNISGLVQIIDDSINPISKVDILNSFSSGTLTANSDISGLSGDLKSNSTISNCFSVSTIQTSSFTLPPNSFSITKNKDSVNSIISNTYFLSSYSLSNACNGSGCGSNVSVTDTYTGGALDINYYYNSSNPPMNGWNFTTIWDSFGLFPIIRFL